MIKVYILAIDILNKMSMILPLQSNTVAVI